MTTMQSCRRRATWPRQQGQQLGRWVRAPAGLLCSIHAPWLAAMRHSLHASTMQRLPNASSAARRSLAVQVAADIEAGAQLDLGGRGTQELRGGWNVQGDSYSSDASASRDGTAPGLHSGLGKGALGQPEPEPGPESSSHWVSTACTQSLRQAAACFWACFIQCRACCMHAGGPAAGGRQCWKPGGRPQQGSQLDQRQPVQPQGQHWACGHEAPCKARAGVPAERPHPARG
jgi:hypothetical protein